MQRTLPFILFYWMSRAFDTIERGILLEDLKEIQEPDILHPVNLLLTRRTHSGKIRKQNRRNFQTWPRIPTGRLLLICFIFYLHKSLQTKLTSQRFQAGPLRDSLNEILTSEFCFFSKRTYVKLWTFKYFTTTQWSVATVSWKRHYAYHKLTSLEKHNLVNNFKSLLFIMIWWCPSGMKINNILIDSCWT